MLVHYYRFASGNIDVGVLFEPVGTQAPARRQLGGDGRVRARHGGHLDVPVRAHAGACRAPARAMGGIDLSWLAGGLSAALTYAVLGGKVHRRYAAAGVNGAGVNGSPPELPWTPSRPRERSVSGHPGSGAVNPVAEERRSSAGRRRTAAASFTFDIDAESCASRMTRPRAPHVADVAPVVRSAGRIPKILRTSRDTRSGRRSSCPASPPSATRTSCARSSTRATRSATTATCTSGCRASAARRRRRYLDRGLEALHRVAGVVPVGYRAPWWEPTGSARAAGRARFPLRLQPARR